MPEPESEPEPKILAKWKDVLDKKSLLMNSEDCGQNLKDTATQRRQLIGRGGELAEEGEYPWMVVVNSCDKNHDCGYCGGSLVGPKTNDDGAKFVLTARHCVNGLADLEVEWDNNTRYSSTKEDEIELERLKVQVGSLKKDTSADNTLSVKRIHYAPCDEECEMFGTYGDLPVERDADMVLLELAKPAPKSLRTGTLCLPDVSNDPTAVAAIENHITMPKNHAVLTGWGATSSNSDGSDILKEYTEVEVSGFSEDNLIMVKTEGPISCKGDSGGPLSVRFVDGRFYQIGVVSFGRKNWSLPGLLDYFSGIVNFVDFVEHIFEIFYPATCSDNEDWYVSLVHKEAQQWLHRVIGKNGDQPSGDVHIS